MKIEQEKSEFKPITLTLETRDEAIHFLSWAERGSIEVPRRTPLFIQIVEAFKAKVNGVV